VEDQKLILDTLDLRDLVNQLYDASIRTSLLMSTRCSLTQFVLMQWSSGAIDHLHYAKSYRPFELFVNENYKL